MDPRFRRRPSLLLDDLASQPLFELGKFRSLCQDVPLEDVPSQNIAILAPEEAADDGACWCDVYDEEEVEPHGSARRTAAPLPRAELQELVRSPQDAPAPPVVTCSDQEFDEWLLGRLLGPMSAAIRLKAAKAGGLCLLVSYRR